MKNSSMGLGGSGSVQSNAKKSTSPVKHAKVANITAKNGMAGKSSGSDALRDCCKHSPVKAKGK